MTCRLRTRMPLHAWFLAGFAWAWAAAPTQAHPATISLVCAAPPELIEPGALQAALERDLHVPVRRVQAPSGPTLRVAASSLSAVEVTFVRAGRPDVGRSIDLSAPGVPVLDTLALLAANLLRDEAAELLPQLSAADTQPQPPPSAAAMPPRCPASSLRRIPVGVDYLPRVGMSTSKKYLEAERLFSLNILGGITGAVRGVELGGVFNLDMYALCGLQMAGVFNYVGGPVTGAQFGMVNYTSGDMVGAQFALVNIDGDTLRGAQFGLANLSAGDVKGGQLGLLNLITGDVTGGQYGLVNVVSGARMGVQAGLVNLASASSRGAQLGLVNVTSSDASGAQVGLLNITSGDVHGAQVGLLNVAKDSDASIGLLNVLWHGRSQVDAWATDAGLLMAGVTHGGRIVHNLYGIGIKPMNGSPALALALGIGVRVLSTERLTLDIDAVNYSLMRKSSARNRFEWGQIGQLRIPFTITIIPNLAVFVAPEVSVSIAKSDTELTDPALYKTTRLTNSNASTTARIWPGLSLGLRFF